MKDEFTKAIQHLSKVIWLSHIPRDEWTTEDSMAFIAAQQFVRQHGEGSTGQSSTVQDEKEGNT